MKGGGAKAGAARLIVAALVFGAAPLGAQDLICDPGDREVRELDFTGNVTFPDRELALRINTTPSSFARRVFRLFGTRRCLDSQELALDAARIQVFYRRRGFYEAKVDTSVAGLGGNAYRVTFRIEEGAPVMIETVTLNGLDSVSSDARESVLDVVRIRPGQRFDQELVRMTADSIRARLRDRGYPRADVALETSAQFAERRALVGFTVVPGPLAYISSIEVRSEPVEGKDQQIPESVVRRLAGLREGALYRESELASAHRNLYGTAAYRHVDVRTAVDSLHPLGDSLRVLIDLREDLMRQLDTEAGWGTLDCFRARAQYVDRNFLDGARRLELTSQLSKIGYGYPLNQAKPLCRRSELDQDPFSDTLHYFVGATLRQPAFRGTRFSPAFSIYREFRGEYLAYLRSTLVGGEASAEREIARLTPLRLAYNLEYGRTVAQPALLCFIFSRCDLESRERLSKRDLPLAVASAAIGRVRIDNPVNPSRGDRYRVELRSASRFIGSDRSQEFTKVGLDATWYRPFVGGSTVAARVRLGAVVGNSPDAGDRSFVPPQERLYAGGATSVRGFQQNELGALVYIAEDKPETVRNEGGELEYTMKGSDIRRVVPTGGNSLVVANIDWRLRSPFYPELLQWTLFTDVGEVWNRGQAGLGFRSLKWTPGLGMRVLTFVGPVQVNVAYNPYSRPAGAVFYDAPAEVVPGEQPLALYCVTPNNGLPVRLRDGVLQQEEGPCRDDFLPQQSRSFFQRLTFTFSIGPDF